MWLLYPQKGCFLQQWIMYYWYWLALGPVPCCVITAALKHIRNIVKQTMFSCSFKYFLVIFSLFFYQVHYQIAKSFHWDFDCNFASSHINSGRMNVSSLFPFSQPKTHIYISPFIQIFCYTKGIKFCGFLHENSQEFWESFKGRWCFLIAFIFKLVIVGI